MSEPAAVRQQVADELRTLRAMSGMSGRAMGSAIGSSQGTVWRIEHAQALPTRPQAEQWLAACAADEERRARVLTLIEDAYRESPTWSRSLSGRGQLQDEAAARERRSGLVRNFQPTIVPGLLQTAEYARLLVPLVDRTGELDVDEHVAKRIDRQAVLNEQGHRFAFLLGERSLRLAPSPAVMPAQLDRLVSATQLPTVELGVLPDTAPVVAWHNFVLHEPVDGAPPYVTAEFMHEQVTVRAPADVAVYVRVWEQLWQAAVVGDAAADWIRRVAAAEARG